MLLLTFFIGLLINAIGYIPPGNINLSVAQLTVNKGIKQALHFIIAFSCVEVFFTFGMMRFARWMSSDVSLEFSVYHINIGTLTDAFMILMFLIMGSITWLRRNKLPQAKEDIPPTIEQTDPIDERNRSSIGTEKESPNCYFFNHFQIKVKVNCFLL
jgi:hypothetical protein